ncbi:MAG: hypothetical protein RIT00_378, partial [Actinomycetota bacterium]
RAPSSTFACFGIEQANSDRNLGQTADVRIQTWVARQPLGDQRVELVGHNEVRDARDPEKCGEHVGRNWLD